MAICATTAYSLLSVPIALKHLSVDEFGLFVLVVQVAGYFSLAEMGMSAATGRFLVDHKDDRDSGAYGSVILTGSLVFLVQAFVILAIGGISAPLIVSLLNISAGLVDTAVFLLRWLAFTSALTVALRIFGSILYANKRLDLINMIATSNMLIGLVMLATILTTGGGLPDLVWLFVVQAGVSVLWPILACRRLGLLPSSGTWGRASVERFKELFAFGKDVFLVNVGSQILEASHLIIVTRTMGLSATAVWSVSTKLFALIYQLITRIEGTAIVFFAEMMVREETGKLATRFRQVYQLTAGVAVVALAGVVAVNRPFVSVWADSTLAWSLPLSLMMAAYVFLNAVTRCSGDLIIHTKQIAAFRYVYFAEAVSFVALALWLSSKMGFYGLLSACLLCLVLFRGSYTTWRAARYFQQPARILCWTWLRRPLVAALLLLPFVFLADVFSYRPEHAWSQLGITLIFMAIPCGWVLFKVALPHDVAEEAIGRFRSFKSSRTQFQ